MTNLLPPRLGLLQLPILVFGQYFPPVLCVDLLPLTNLAEAQQLLSKPYSGLVQRLVVLKHEAR